MAERETPGEDPLGPGRIPYRDLPLSLCQESLREPREGPENLGSRRSWRSKIMKPINSDYWVWCRSTSPHERSPCSPAFFVGNPWPRPMPSRDGRAWSSSTRSRTGAGRCVCLRDDPFRAQPAVAHAFSTFLEFRLQCEEMCKRATEASTALPSSHYYSGSSSRTSRT